MTQEFTEAPASFTVKAVSPDGYDCMLTIRDESTQGLVTRALAALAWLKEHEFGPTGHGQPATAAEPGKPAPSLPDGRPDPAWCPVHGVAMSRREKDGQVWYSHKAPDGFYCKGKANEKK